MMKLPRPATRFCFFFHILLFAFPLAAEEKISSQEREFFENKVRPLLSEKCYKCHSAGRKPPKAELYLDTSQGVLAGGRAAPPWFPGSLQKAC